MQRINGNQMKDSFVSKCYVARMVVKQDETSLSPENFCYMEHIRPAVAE